MLFKARSASTPQGDGKQHFYVPGAGFAQQPYKDGWDLRRAVDAGFGANIAVFASIRAISTNAAKLTVVARKKNWRTGPTFDHPVADLLSGRPSPYEDAVFFRKRLSQILLLNRQGVFVELVRNRRGEVIGLYLLPPGYTSPIPDEKKFVSGYRVDYPGRAYRDLAPEDVIWIREPHPTDPYAGATPLEAAGLSIETDWYARLYNRNFLRSDGRPSGLVVVKGFLDDDDQKELNYRFSGGGGPGNAGRVSILSSEDGADFVDLSTSPREVSYSDGRKASKDDVLGAFGCPESVAFANASGRTFDNADAELAGFWRETMLPHLSTIARALDPILDNDPTHFVSFDWTEVPVLELDERARRKFLLEELGAKAITEDEYREQTGRPPLPKPDPAAAPGDTPAATPPGGQDGLPQGLGKPARPKDGLWDPKRPFGPNRVLQAAGLPSGEAKDDSGRMLELVDVPEFEVPQTMVAFYPPADVARRIAIPGRETPEELHVTLVYTGRLDGRFTLDALKGVVTGVAATVSPFEARLSGSGVFNQPDGTRVLWASIDAPGLAEFRSVLYAALCAAGIEPPSVHGYTPHMTLAYLQPGEPVPPVDIPDVSFLVSQVAVAVDDHAIRIDLAGGRVHVKARHGQPWRPARARARTRPQPVR